MCQLRKKLVTVGVFSGNVERDALFQFENVRNLAQVPERLDLKTKSFYQSWHKLFEPQASLGFGL